MGTPAGSDASAKFCFLVLKKKGVIYSLVEGLKSLLKKPSFKLGEIIDNERNKKKKLEWKKVAPFELFLHGFIFALMITIIQLMKLEGKEPAIFFQGIESFIVSFLEFLVFFIAIRTLWIIIR